MQNVDAAPALLRRRYGGGKRRFLSDVGFVSDAFAAFLLDHRHGLLGRSKIAIDSHDLGTFLRESQHRGTAIANSFAPPPPDRDHGASLSFSTHSSLSAIYRVG